MVEFCCKPMSLLAFGVNHETAPVNLRERLSFAPEDVSTALAELVDCDGVEEAAILSTCNRTDIYCGVKNSEIQTPLDWFHRFHTMQPDELNGCLYTHVSQDAVRHMMRVASGLDSMILGEPQIFGQIKDAYRTARDSGTVGRVLGRLFEQTFSVAKQVRTDTAIGSSPVSVAFAAVTMARQILGDLSEYTAMLVGAGETIELVARHLAKNNLGRLIVANRTLENAHQLAAVFDGYAISLPELHQHLHEADIVVTSTAAKEPILTREMVEHASRKRRHRPVFMLDIAVPRDIAADTAELEDVFLYTVDDLRGVIEENLKSRQEAARQADEIIDTHVQHFMGWLGTLDATAAIRAYREGAERTRDEVLRNARRMLDNGRSVDAVLDYLANTITNKLVHVPTSRLRQAGADRQDDLIAAAHALLGLDNTKI